MDMFLFILIYSLFFPFMVQYIPTKESPVSLQALRKHVEKRGKPGAGVHDARYRGVGVVELFVS